jgi:predicted dehydrogenase
MIIAGLIGVSGFGNVHYHDLLREHEAGRMKYLAATVINQPEEPEKCAKLRSLGVEIFEDHRAMLKKFAGKLNLVCIPTGIALHAPMAIDAMKAGANVLIEKPAAATVQEVIAMQEAEKEYGKFTAVSFQSIYSAELQDLKKQILEGVIGKITRIVACGLEPRTYAYYTRNNWAGCLKGKRGEWVLDSPYNNAVAHQLNMMTFLAGKSFEKPAGPVSATAELYHANKIESADTASIAIETAEGIPLYFYVSHAAESCLRTGFKIYGTAGTIDVTLDTFTIESSSGKKEIPWQRDHVALRGRIMESVRARIANPKAFYCSLDIARAHTLCVNGAHESSAWITQINPEAIHETGEGKDLRIEVKGMDEAVKTAAAKMQMLSQVNPDLFKGSGRKVSLVDYRKFPAGK